MPASPGGKEMTITDGFSKPDQRFCNFISGEWRDGQDGPPNLNPARPQEVLGQSVEASVDDVEEAVESAVRTQSAWAETTPSDRSAILHRFANILEEDADFLGMIITSEEGKSFAEGRSEVLRAASEARFMAGEALRLYGETIPSVTPTLAVRRERVPIGPVAAITPWNFPVVAPVRKIAPAIACGNTVVFKPASLTPWSAVRLVELFQAAGVPPGVLNLLIGSGARIGNALVEANQIKGVTFTGSTEIGRTLLERSAKSLKKVQLEMGGKNAALIFDPIDIENAAEEIVNAAFASSGQRCTAISRVIVDRRIEDELVEKMVQRTRMLVVGDGRNESTNIGPLVSAAQVQRVRTYCDIAKSEGASIAFGGDAPSDEYGGYYFNPTVLTSVRPGSTVAREEIFGPVLSVIAVDMLDEGISVVNETSYGLAGCVFSNSVEVVSRFRRMAQVGMVHVNHGTASQPHVPFGGDRESGYGAFSIGSTAKDFYLKDRIIYGV